MTWHDGSAEFSAAELTQEYTVKVTDNLRLTGDGRKLAVINDFTRGTALYELADPKIEEEEEGKHIFCHVFLDKERSGSPAGLLAGGPGRRRKRFHSAAQAVHVPLPCMRP